MGKALSNLMDYFRDKKASTGAKKEAPADKAKPAAKTPAKKTTKK